MSRKATILGDAAAQHKRPWSLTSEEVHRLMQAFTRDKCMVLEEDCLTLCRWAQAQKRGALALAGVLAGHLVPLVEAGEVRVTLRSH